MNKKKRMPEIGEAVFCIIYLIFGFISAIIMFANADARSFILFYGVLTLVLAGGDSFHLVPRIIKAFSYDFKTYEFWAGLGLMISSITMTVFYIILYYIWDIHFATGTIIPGLVKYLLLIMALVRIILCLFPQNNWFQKEGNAKWGIIRNLPFVIVGIIMIILFLLSGNWNISLAILISFACYLPVVLWAKKKPMIGMLMIPKTVAYMYLIAIGLSLI